MTTTTTIIIITIITSVHAFSLFAHRDYVRQDQSKSIIPCLKTYGLPPDRMIPPIRAAADGAEDSDSATEQSRPFRTVSAELPGIDPSETKDYQTRGGGEEARQVPRNIPAKDYYICERQMS